MAKRQGAPVMAGSWDSLSPPLTPWIRAVIADLGHAAMTPVQAGTIPRAVKNQDCVVEAVTGSGKTLAFVVPVLERLCRRAEPFKKGEIAAVVVAPTRQIHDVFHTFLASIIPPAPPPDPDAPADAPPPPAPDAPYPLPMLVTSGTPTLYETFTAVAPQILIGTPGRLATFLLSPRGQRLVRCAELDCLVLDEADRLLGAPDHRRDVERIMRALPKQRRTHLFSATMTDAVEELVGLGLRNPVRIVVNLRDRRGDVVQERRVPTALQNTFLVCRQAEKTVQMIRLLQYETATNAAAKFIIYFSTCAAVDYFYRILSRLPELSAFHLTSLHGDLPPRVRTAALSAFTSHASSSLAPAVLLCTDVAARGVDFADIDVVIQYDPPMDPKTFSHRAGRTARAGRRGKAVVLLCKGREEEYVDFLAVRKIPLAPQPYLSSALAPAPLPASVDPAAAGLLAAMRALLGSDRELHDRAARAYVSAVRAYTKHEAAYIFRPADVAFGALAVAYGLLRLPRMPEIRDWKKRRAGGGGKSGEAADGHGRGEDGGGAVEAVAGAAGGDEEAEAGPSTLADGPDSDGDDWADADIDWDTFAYASKPREAQRLAELAAAQAKRAAAAARSAAGAAAAGERGEGGEAGEGGEDGASGSEGETARKKRRVRAGLNAAWSEQKERRARKDERRDKRDKRAAARFAAAGDGEAGGMVREFIARRGGGERGHARAGDGEAQGEAEGAGEMDGEWRALRRAVKAERAGRQAAAAPQRGMFDDLD